MNQETLMIDLKEIQKKYLPLSLKRIRRLANTYLHTIKVGNKLLVSRKELIEFLSDPDRDHIK